MDATLDILFHLDRDLEQFSPDVVVAMMGINDAGRTHAHGPVIAPGADRWYGSFRVYKLYRLLRDAVRDLRRQRLLPRAGRARRLR
jgi:hypothetical protein